MPIRIAALAAAVVLAASSAGGQPAADTGHKSAALAGIASYFLPGVGSWYAGNEHHARVHGGIAIGIGVAAMGLSLVADCVELACKEEAPNVALGVLMAGYLTNAIWSTVTAVQDAHAYNDRATQLRTGRLDLAPTVRIGASPGGGTRYGIGVRVGL